NFTFYVVAGRFSMGALFLSVAIAFMAVNVLLVNNYRDMEDDREAGKITATVRVGRTATLVAYFLNGVAAMLVMAPFWVLAQNTRYLSPLTLCALPIYLIIHSTITLLMHQWRGHKLNPLLGLTALNMLLFTVIISAMFELCRGSGFSW
ncbi:MAG: prenyltransferase, partial [Muribaculaceae bacterium]|nr:prenyltransferase [Muribaculaceae bacterium]